MTPAPALLALTLAAAPAPLPSKLLPDGQAVDLTAKLKRQLDAWAASQATELPASALPWGPDGTFAAPSDEPMSGLATTLQRRRLGPCHLLVVEARSWTDDVRSGRAWALAVADDGRLVDAVAIGRNHSVPGDGAKVTVTLEKAGLFVEQRWWTTGSPTEAEAWDRADDSRWRLTDGCALEQRSLSGHFADGAVRLTLFDDGAVVQATWESAKGKRKLEVASADRKAKVVKVKDGGAVFTAKLEGAHVDAALLTFADGATQSLTRVREAKAP